MSQRPLLGWCPFLIALALSSCAAQIEQKMKTAAMLSPEALGGWPHVEAGAGYMSAPIVRVTDDARTTPPDTARSRVLDEEKIFLHGAVGLLERVDVSLDPASWANLKVQLLGEPFSRSKGGNLSLSVFASGWTEKDDGRGSGLDLNDDNTLSVAPNVRYTKKVNSWRGGLLLGYRLASPFMVYLGTSYQEHRYSGDYSIVSGARGRYAGFASASVLSLGLELALGKSFVIRLEDAISRVKVPAHGARSSQHSVGLLLAGVIGKKE